MSRRWSVPAALVVILGVFVGLGAMAGSLYWSRVESHGEQLTRVELAKLTADEIPKVLGYEYTTVERSLTETYPMFTPDYRREFEARAVNDIIPQAREKQLVNQVDVVGVGALDAKRTTGSVLVFVNRTVTGKSKEKFYEGSRLRVDFRKVDRQWLISNIAPI
ncbi:mammalian cell entry protein [Mycolicibacter sp. MYC123]|uniref:Mammalian cell entry protein n=2 Tax=Mycolicibacter TaxID=1073531 RepID=A0ABU5YDY8_9MYCO|nr:MULTISPECIES: mammalian cell entry protein [unclassified Mycolicibacter]MEB3048256.1 mammalian cell entry protein [Mycolicibacter sp. MYC123]MEB3070980.1 mammalian cell entry protein [Mycolicibacter sp. MYC017]